MRQSWPTSAPRRGGSPPGSALGGPKVVRDARPLSNDLCLPRRLPSSCAGVVPRTPNPAPAKTWASSADAVVHGRLPAERRQSPTTCREPRPALATDTITRRTLKKNARPTSAGLCRDPSRYRRCAKRRPAPEAQSGEWCPLGCPPRRHLPSLGSSRQGGLDAAHVVEAAGAINEGDRAESHLER